MNDQQPNHSSAPEEVEAKGPGRQLREVRQYHRLTIDDVARYLRLDTATICNLEEEDYGKLPGPAFIRGYYRAYANALNLDPESILHRFEDSGLASPALVKEDAHRPQIHSSHIAVRATTVLVIFGLIALMFSWWQTRLPLLPEEDVAGEAAAKVSAESAGSPQTSSPPPDRLPATQGMVVGMRANRKLSGEPAGGSAAGESANSAEGEEPSAPAPERDAAVSANAMAEKPDTPAAPAVPPPDRAPPEAAPGITAPPPTAPPPMEQRPEQRLDQPKHLDHLALHLEEDCWIEVEDGRGRQLYYKVGLAGKTYEFQGARPFLVTLGYARGVTVVYNGKRFDHTPHIQRDFAEFSLGN